MGWASDILAIDDLPRAPVEIPEWGSPPLFVRSITAAERGQFEDVLKTSRRDAFAWFAAFTLVDSDGRRVFCDDDVPRLGGKSSSAIMRIVEAAAKVNAMRSQDMEALEKNSLSGQTGDSPSGSPHN